MCKFWKKFCQHEGRNHHFPELIKGKDLRAILWRATASKLLVMMLVAGNFFLGFCYFNFTNQTASAGYRIKDLEKELTELQQENSRLNLSYLKLQSIESISAEAQKLKLEPISSVDTISMSETPAIALNR